MNDVHLVVLTGKFITTRGGRARSVSDLERSDGNVIGYALSRGLAEPCWVVIKY